jgi:hypothetical protein
MLKITPTLLQSGVRGCCLFPPYRYIALNHLQQAGRKKWLHPKPKLRAKFDEHGQLILPTKIAGYTKDDIEKLKNIVKRSILGVSEDQKAEIAQRALDNFIEGKWGQYIAEKRIVVRKWRIIKKKRRYAKIGMKTIERWNEREDMREQKIIRDKERELREAKGEKWSFKEFLKTWREKKKKPYVIPDEETFQKILEEDKRNYLWKGPKFLKLRGRENWETLFIESIKPFAYELQRRARIAHLVNQREEALAKKKFEEEVAKRRAEREAEREKLRAEKAMYWNKIVSEWQAENQKLRELKAEYRLAREAVYAKAREEFLSALQEEMDKWVETPDEAKWLRFHFVEGVVFPYKKTEYR